ncbi:Hypothetical protein CpMEX30_1748 [Corynebacterium pseudotuberculosis]|uniref:Uncharacterized protein n=2 Tax=Corynebacterium pseudotuberculosis TaxID=1719 RepID=D9QC57_CORP2|nr:hypothetical protein CPC231_08415 [Corynebacterium pseudotuberculosis C231]ADL21539.1 hypothetical protein CP1002_04730 [Corynebacterium pseudotuberculosis 1002]ADO26936.1 hypothetical protein CPI19_03105 [Corynebacterium pseudotuberculosis I19]AEK92996.1 Hypothetical protein CpPAT10_1671 [Corynebacterium pseudotuberculosis PAT10]AEP70904.1 Hypothetical protein Cp4202_1661 [Corynebacterium pseudotuberculosis 42/02-A]AEQ07204.1 hypothetical protein CPCIP5297_08640 [Corynebacterium pseudotube
MLWGGKGELTLYSSFGLITAGGEVGELVGVMYKYVPTLLCGAYHWNYLENAVFLAELIV